MKRLIGLLMVAACGGDPLMLEAYPAAWLDVGCDYLVRCGAVDSVETCRETRSASEFEPELVAAVTAGTVRWNGDAAEDCLDRLGQASCDRTSESYRRLGCEPLFTGTLGRDAACTMSIECVSNECWTEGCTEACCVGYCTGDLEPKIGEIDEPCRLSGCVAGARCEDSLCVPLIGEDAACAHYADNVCGYGLGCINGFCAVPHYNGDPCIEGSCALIGELCGVHGVCEPVRRLGYPCTQSSHCDVTFVCGPDSTCTPAPRIGEACAGRCYDAGAFCAGDTGVCTRPTAAGAPCSSSEECESQYCFDGACVSCAD